MHVMMASNGSTIKMRVPNVLHITLFLAKVDIAMMSVIGVHVVRENTVK